MRQISSKDNSIIKECSSLKEKKYRDEFGLYLVEGPNLVKELTEFGGRPRFIFIKAGASAEAKQIAAEADKSLAVYELSEPVFLKLATSETPQDILAVAEKNTYTPDLFFKAVGNKNVLVLDRLQDPGNMGTLLRTAEALGFGGAIVLKGSTDPYQPKVVRAAAGSLLRLPLLFVSDADTLLKMLKVFGKKPYAACMEGNVALNKADLKENSAIIIGNEGNGVCEEFKTSCDRLFIPMDGSMESLNAAVAATIIMYESKRQRL